MPVPEKSCEVPNCTYKTPDGLPSYEARRRELGLHLAMAHPDAARLWAEVNGQAGPAAPAAVKLERLPRPVFSLNMTEALWQFKVIEWRSYISQDPATTPDTKLFQ